MDFGLGVLLEAKDLFSGTFQRAGAAFQGFAGTTSAAGQAIAGNLKALGVGLTIFSTGIAALHGLQPMLAAGKEFSAGIAEITTLTDEASLSFGRLEDIVFDANAAFGGGAKTQIKAVYDGISAGASNAAESTALLAGSNRLAVAGVTSVSVALDGLTSSLNAYGQAFTAGNIQSFSDTFFTAVRMGKTKVEELAHVIGRVAPTASAMGMSFDEVAASVAAMTTKGMKTEEAVTGLKAALANIIKPGAHAAAEAARLGVKFDQAALRSKGFTKFMNDIVNAKGFKADTMSKLFESVEGMNAMLALSANKGAKYNETMAEMAKKTGASDAAFDKMSRTLAFQEKRFQGLLENAKIVVGQALEPLAAKVTGFAASIADAFLRLPAPVRDFIVKGAAVASVLLTIFGAAIAGRAAFMMMRVALGGLGISLAGIATSLAPVVIGLGLAALAVYAFKVAIAQNLGGLGVMAANTFEKIGLLGRALGQAFEEGGFSGAVRDELNKAENIGIKAFAIKVYVWVARIQEYFKGLVEGIQGYLSGNEPVFARFSEAVAKLAACFDGLFFSASPEKSSEAFDAAGNGGKSAGRALGQLAIVLVRAATAFVDFIRAMVPVGEAVGKAVTSVGGLRTVIWVLEAAMVIFAARAAYQMVMSLYSIATASGAAAAGLFRVVAATLAQNGITIASSAQAIRMGLQIITQGAITALVPVLALSAAIGALLLVWDQATKLKNEWDGDTFWREVRHDLGLMGDDEYAKKSTSGTTAEEYDRRNPNLAKAKVQQNVTLSSQAPPNSSQPLPAASMVPAAGGDQGALMSQVAATMAQAQKEAAAATPLNVSLGVSLDGDQLMSKIETMSRDRADRGHKPGIPVAG